MKQKGNRLILIPSLILILFWIAFSIYHNLVSSTISETLNVQISAISPSFDSQTIQALRARKQFTPLYSISAPSQPAAASPSSSTSSTGSATIGNAKQATLQPGGQASGAAKSL